MKKKFFEKFVPAEKTQNRSISMLEGEWRQLEAYRLYGSATAGHEIPLQKIVREIVTTHIASDRQFSKVKEEWIAKTDQITPQEASDA
ncbi:MAG: hypothetical protein H6618_08750 [Deltaproteobacteria bacterium]|nr:hypothetical protein [Deltaproteobacteria bacterium]